MPGVVDGFDQATNRRVETSHRVRFVRFRPEPRDVPTEIRLFLEAVVVAVLAVELD